MLTLWPADDLSLANFGGKETFLRVLGAARAHHGHHATEAVELKRLKSMVATLASRDRSVARTLVWQASTALARHADDGGTVALAAAQGSRVKNVGPAPIAAALTACYPPPPRAPSSPSPPTVERGAVVAVFDQTVVTMADGSGRKVHLYLVPIVPEKKGWPAYMWVHDYHPLSDSRTLEPSEPEADSVAVGGATDVPVRQYLWDSAGWPALERYLSPSHVAASTPPAGAPPATSGAPPAAAAASAGGASDAPAGGGVSLALFCLELVAGATALSSAAAPPLLFEGGMLFTAVANFVAGQPVGEELLATCRAAAKVLRAFALEMRQKASQSVLAATVGALEQLQAALLERAGELVTVESGSARKSELLQVLVEGALAAREAFSEARDHVIPDAAAARPVATTLTAASTTAPTSAATSPPRWDARQLGPGLELTADGACRRAPDFVPRSTSVSLALPAATFKQLCDAGEVGAGAVYAPRAVREVEPLTFETEHDYTNNANWVEKVSS